MYCVITFLSERTVSMCNIGTLVVLMRPYQCSLEMEGELKE